MSMLRDYLGRRFNNSPEEVDKVSDYFDEWADVIKGSILGDLSRAVESGERATSLLFCSYFVMKNAGMESGFRSEVDEARGSKFGFRLINWVLDKSEIEISNNLKMVWTGLYQTMGGSIEMMIRNLEPSLAPGSIPSPQWVQGWIKSQGGLEKLYWTWMDLRKTESADQKSREATLKKFGLQQMELQEANDAGFDTAEEYKQHRAKVSQRKKQESLREKIEELKKRLVQNGTPVEGTPPDNRLFITSGGKLYLLSEEDEFNLLHCGASTIV